MDANSKLSLVPALLLGIALAGPAVSAAAQDGSPDDDWEVPRTVYGHPDLQGNWTNATLTPIQRPQDQEDLVLTPEQVAAIEGGVENLIEDQLQDSDPDRPPPPQGGDFDIPESVLSGSFIAAGGGTGGYNIVYIESGTRVARVHGEPRSSLITIPEDGRLPDVTDEAAEWRRERAAGRAGLGAFDHPELRSPAERCILSFGSNAGPPMLPNGFYNNNYTIVQSADHVAIMTEMVHDTRIIRLGDGPRLPDHVRPYFGDSWGHWEGETLVVETTNIHPDQGYNLTPTEGVKVIERFTRTGPDEILYEFRVEGPEVWTEPWGGQVPMRRMEQPVYEYACHEGNYALENMLSGARWEERQEAEGEEAPE